MEEASPSAPRAMAAHPAGSFLLLLVLPLPTTALPGFSCRKSAVSSQSRLGKLESRARTALQRQLARRQPPTSQNPPASLRDAGNPQNEGEIQRHRAQGLYFSHGDLGKAEDGTPGMQQHFFEGAHVRGSSMRHSLVGWLLVLKPLGGGIWMPSTDLGAQAIGACAHQPGKSRGDR